MMMSKQAKWITVVLFLNMTLVCYGAALAGMEWRCGDGQCDENEQANPFLCPRDCVTSNGPARFRGKAPQADLVTIQKEMEKRGGVRQGQDP